MESLFFSTAAFLLIFFL